MEDRKLKILAAVVDEYIRTGEPVGSKALTALPELSVSSATIRNDMSALEQQGYLEQPHTSAGRVPSYKGYRLYIDQLMQPQPLSKRERALIDELFPEDLDSDDAVVSQASKALAELTRLPALVSNVSPQFSVISRVEVIPTGRRLYLLLLITSGGTVKNKICRLEFDLQEEHLNFFRNFMSENLQGIRPDNLSPAMIQTLATTLGGYMLALSPLLFAVYEMSSELLKASVGLEGETRLISLQEFDPNEVVRFIESKNELSRLLADSFDGIHVLFGKENQSCVITNSSLVLGGYSNGSEAVGSMGVIGPMRINYAKIIPYIEYLTGKVTDRLSKKEEEQDKNE